MKRPIIVFDFDRTLTNADTLFGYYRIVNESNFNFEIKRALLFCSALCYKFGIIGNDKLKQLGIRLFLRGLSRDWLEKKAKLYAHSIKLNQIYYQIFLNIPKENRMIISASFEIYLKKIFPDEKIIGSQLKFSHGKLIGLERNMYGETKKKYLKEKGIPNIDCLYTDSYSDLPVMKIAKRVLLVKEGAILKNGIENKG